MADPYIHTSMITTTQDVGEGDPEARQSLDQVFDDFFKSAPEPGSEERKEAESKPPFEPPDDTGEEPEAKAPPVKEMPKPEAAKVGKPAEKPPEKPQKNPVPKPLAEPAKKEELPPEEKKPEPAPAADKPEEDDIEALEPPPNARPQLKADFHTLKDKVRAYKAEVQTTKSELEAVRREAEARAKELEELRKAPAPPEVQKQLQELESRATSAEHIARFHDLRNDPSFKQEHDGKIRELYEDIIDTCVQISGNDPRVKEWGEKMKTESGPDDYDRDWWKQGVESKIADEDDRAEVKAKVRQLLSMRGTRDKKLAEFQKDPERLNKYLQERQEKYWADFYAPTFTKYAQSVAPKELGDWAVKKDPSTAKTEEERKALRAHNEEYQVFENHLKQFVEWMNDGSERKPELHARVALAAVKGIKLERDMGRLSTDLKAAQEALDAKAKEADAAREEAEKLQEQLDKISKVKSVPAKTGNSNGTGRASTPASKLTQTADEAFEEFFKSK